MRSIFFAILMLALNAATLNAQLNIDGPHKHSDEAAERRLAAFEMVWKTVNDNHYDPTFGGVDWAAVRTKYEPLAKATKTDGELHALLGKMLGELKLSHFGVFETDPNIETGEHKKGSVGVEIKQSGGKMIVFQVINGSSAEAAGIKRGTIIRGINGKTVEELLKPLDKALAERETTTASKTIYRERTVAAILDGEVGSVVKVDISFGDQPDKTIEIKRTDLNIEMSQAMGNFPPQEVFFESKRLDGDIGYIRFNMWIMPQMAKIRAAMAGFADAKGLIVDLRGNPGGIGGMAPGFGGLIFDKQVSLGSMKSRANTMNFIVYPQKDPFLGKVVLLTDHGSGSTSEVFAAGLQELGRAKIVGTTSAGAVLPSVFTKLPTGATFQYAISDYRSPQSVLIEGKGVEPDVTIDLDIIKLQTGKDSQLEKAVEIILGK